MEVLGFPNELYLSPASCDKWISLQNFTFHLSMVAYLLAFFTLLKIKFYVEGFHALILIAVLFQVVWGAFFWCTYDVLSWGAIYFLQNFMQLIYAVYGRRGVKFTNELENVYKQTFESFNVTRHEFQALVHHHCKMIKVFPGDKYAVEGCTSVDERVSLLITGRMRCMFRGEYLHDINSTEIIDSVEWESSKLKRGEIFQVTIEAVDTCTYLCWNREKLQFYLDANPKLMAAFQYYRGHDILRKIHGTAMTGYRRNVKKIGQAEEELKNVSITNIRQGIAEEDPNAIYSSH